MDSVFITNFTQAGEILGRWCDETSFTLNRFGNNCRRFFSRNVADEKVLQVIGAGSVAGRVREAEACRLNTGMP